MTDPSYRHFTSLLFSWNDPDISLVYYLLDEKQNNIYLIWFCSTIIIDSENWIQLFSFSCMSFRVRDRRLVKSWKSKKRKEKTGYIIIRNSSAVRNNLSQLWHNFEFYASWSWSNCQYLWFSYVVPREQADISRPYSTQKETVRSNEYSFKSLFTSGNKNTITSSCMIIVR